MDEGRALLARYETFKTAFNRDFDAFVENELEAWWAVAGGLVTCAVAAPNRYAFYRAHDDEFQAIARDERFWGLLSWYEAYCTNATYAKDLPHKVDGAWVHLDACAIDKDGRVCRGTKGDVVNRI